MIVETINHAKKVFRHFSSCEWTVLDTETKPQDPAHPKDALVFGRMRIFIFSACYRGESYSFPTSLMDPKYPTIHEYTTMPEFIEVCRRRTIFHNANYDWMAFHAADPSLKFKDCYCTMTGAWMANPGREQGLKARAPLYGRHLHKTATIDFSNLADVSVYAEEDVVVADELYQVQQFGFCERPKYLFMIQADGTNKKVKNHMPAGKFTVEGESLGEFEKMFMDLHELPYLRATFRSEKFGFPCSREKLKVIRKKVEAARDSAQKQIYRMAGKVFNINSGPQKAAVMASLGISSPFKTAKGADCLNAAALVKMQMSGNNHPFITALQTFSSMTKMANYTDLNKGLAHYVSPKGRIHASARTVGAVTGRGSSSNPNLQQVPSRKDVFGIKDSFEAPKGQSLIVLDHAGLELRIMAILSQEQRMADVLNDKSRDIHGETATRFSVDRDPTAKQINFLLQYAGLAWALAEKLTIEGVPTTPQQAQVYVDIYANDRPRVLQYREELLQHHEKHGFIYLLTGRKRPLVENVRWRNPRDRHRAETTLSNNVVQGTGQDILKAAIIRTDWQRIDPDSRILRSNLPLKPSFKAYLRDRVRENTKVRELFRKTHTQFVLQVHDEAIFATDDSAREECGHALGTVMCRKHFFPALVPYNTALRVEGGIDKTWRQAKSKKADIRLDIIADYL